MTCHICNGNDLINFPESKNLSYVSSDVNPTGTGCEIIFCQACGAVQKKIDPYWNEQVRNIYETYKVFSPSSGRKVQLHSESGPPYLGFYVQKLVEVIKRHIDPSAVGSFLDFGCGNGALLKEFHGQFQHWRLEGSELQEGMRSHVCSIPGVKEFHSGYEPEIKTLFDVISLSHVLEHLVDPVSTLKKLSNNLKENGLLIIGVPNLRTSPFDLIITDHCSHYTIESLVNLAQLAGFYLKTVDDKSINKEIIAIFVKKQVANAPLMPPLEGTQGEVKNFISRLIDIKSRVSLYSSQSRPIGIFGSSIAACFVAQNMPIEFDFFIDEDNDRVGLTLMNKPILSIKDVPFESELIFPLPVEIIQGILPKFASSNMRVYSTYGS